jgi:hypothetical protein
METSCWHHRDLPGRSATPPLASRWNKSLAMRRREPLVEEYVGTMDNPSRAPRIYDFNPLPGSSALVPDLAGRWRGGIQVRKSQIELLFRLQGLAFERTR